MVGPVILIFVATSDAGSPAVGSLQHAIVEALGAEARVEVRAFPVVPGDEASMAEGRASEATAVVRLSWEDPERLRAALHVDIMRTGESRDQLVAFQPSDPQEERGRALGFVVASYLIPSHAPGASAQPPSVVVAPAAPTPAPRWALAAFGVGAFGREGEGSTLGGGVAARRRVGERWGLSGTVRARGGSVAEAQASSLALAAALGVYRLVAGGNNPLQPALGLRAEAAVVYQSLQRFSSEEQSQPDWRGRLLPGAAGFIELGWPLAPSLAIHLALGVEAAFGPTEIFVNDAKVAQIGLFRAVAEAGFRARF